MRRRKLLIPLILSLLGGASGPGQGEQGDRSRILLRLDCGSQLGRQELTLFANGTVRLREQLATQTQVELSDLGRPVNEDRGDLHMYLGELSPEDLEAYLARFRKENISESEENTELSVGGAWIEKCHLQLRLPGQPSRDLSFGRYDSLSLGTAQVVRIARELIGKVDRSETLDPPFPPAYDPVAGDVLERNDGYRFEVVRSTDDGKGLELEGIDQPVTIFINKDNLRGEFRRLVRRSHSTIR